MALSTPSSESSPLDLALETRELRKTFGPVVAVDGVSLRVPRGSFYGFLGPNGAGKSTTLRCLTGLLRPTSGTMRILGYDPLAEPKEVKARIGVVPEELALFGRLTATETLELVGTVHGIRQAEIERRCEKLLRLLDLDAAADALAEEYSQGMRKKLSLAAALLPGPRMLFLDEPFEGVDAVTGRQVRKLLSSFVEGGGTVFLTSHVLDVVERLCDHLAIIHRGRLIAQGSVEELRGGRGPRSLEEIFLELVGAEELSSDDLDWLS